MSIFSLMFIVDLMPKRPNPDYWDEWRANKRHKAELRLLYLTGEAGAAGVYAGDEAIDYALPINDVC